MANTAAGAATACFVFASDDLFYDITVSVFTKTFISGRPISSEAS